MNPWQCWGQCNDKDTPRVPGMRKKIKKRFLIWVRNHHENSAEVTLWWTWERWSSQEEAVDKIMLFGCLCYLLFSTLRCFPMYSWHWGKSNRSICIDVIRRKGMNGQQGCVNSGSGYDHKGMSFLIWECRNKDVPSHFVEMIWTSKLT